LGITISPLSGTALGAVPLTPLKVQVCPLDGNGHCTVGKNLAGNVVKLVWKFSGTVEVFCDLRGEVVVWERENRLGMRGSIPTYAHIKKVYAVKKNSQHFNLTSY